MSATRRLLPKNRAVHPCPLASEQKILNFLALRGTATTAQIAGVLKSTRSTAEIHLKTLFDQGEIFRARSLAGSGRPFLYSRSPQQPPLVSTDQFTNHFFFHSEVTCHKCQRICTGTAWITAVLAVDRTFISAALHCLECHREDKQNDY